MSAKPFHLFDVYGVELEYMIVDAESLAVTPIADQVIHHIAGEYVSEVELGEIAWSNELMAHVIELKTNGPAADLAKLPELFQQHVRQINDILRSLGARLMPTAMHPWMDPHTEAKLWPHEYNAVYEAFDRIFDCRGHGWANLQSAHLNLPFADEEEFGRLHAAIRLLLPLLPALAASSPILDGSLTGILDNRMEVYRNNARAVPAVAGEVVPEAVFTYGDYQSQIFDRMYRDIAPHDPENVLRQEWLNSRGAIARFQRNTIEIRVLDVQECPLADVAICAAIAGVLKLVVGEKWSPLQRQMAVSTSSLSSVLLDVVREGEEAVLENEELLLCLGATQPQTAGKLWQRLIMEAEVDERFSGPLATITTDGPLARRIMRRIQETAEPASLYRELCECLAQGQVYHD